MSDRHDNPARDARISCGELLAGEYCARCGERRFDRRSHTVRHFVSEFVNLATLLDSRFLKSIVLLLFRPGFLTAEYITGRKKKYVRPLVLFAIANVIYFFVQPLANINTFNSTLRMQQRDYVHSPWVRAQIENRFDIGSDTYEEFRARYDRKSEGLARSLIIIQIPLFALLTALIHIGTRRLFFDYLVWSTHVYAFILFLNVIMTAGVFVYFKLGGNDFSLALPFVLAVVIYMLLALRMAFGERYWAAGIRTLLLTGCIAVVIELYRFVLFVLTFNLT